jgi:tRNA threonylcarbamoyladenosine biosynthesis protein TsaE
LAIGIEDYLGADGVTVVEWAEKIAALLPEQTVRIQLQITGESTRRITVE